MREILFRGKRKSDGKWIDGDLSRCVVVGETHIRRIEDNLSTTTHRIDHETVCQYTGLTDKNGRKIFEGDIISVFIRNLSGGKFKHVGIVKYDDLSFVVQWIRGNYSCLLGSFKGNNPFGDQMSEIEIIGNIFDNPELLNGGQ